MPLAPPTFDVDDAQTWFAKSLNNLAWDLVEKEDRDDEETQKMIHATHASCWHWMQFGEDVHRLRSENLLATVYAQAQIPVLAVRHAENCLRFSDSLGEQQTPFDRAVALGCAGLAYRCAGHVTRAVDMQQRANDAAERLEHEEERSLFQKLYGPR